VYVAFVFSLHTALCFGGGSLQAVVVVVVRVMMGGGVGG
jgi:hypothetical protein